MPTIDDVSRLANVSKATVSRVLTGTRGVREESREAVLRAVEQLNYRPNFAAQNLASQTSGYVGIVLPADETRYPASLLPSLARGLQGLGKSLLVQYADDADELAARVDELRHQCAAVVVAGLAELEAAAENVIPFDAGTLHGSGGYDYAFATESACRYLLGKGHRHIALLIDSDGDAASQQMVEGYRTVLQNFSLPLNRQLLISAGNDVEQALLALINSFTKYSAIIVKRDRHAAEAMRLMREFNIAVPQEVSLLSLEDSALAALLYPPLTCISYPAEALLEQCLQRVKALIEARPARLQENRPITGRLVTRASVADVS
ncbi:LacI family DNA-binding transcriptional regulator [Entomohabitans teleogrylli]|uniref:LacI family DNA-binding transcriptional regulator n=1 Tax=Entomohabitans teleogrylli TaxID=1384589 RepID=UPI00073D3A12|nr:LacI family DNA-binding transcriptional regulator [Entomohabitans teleogrylli]